MHAFVDFLVAVVRAQVDEDVPRDITGPEFPPSASADMVFGWGLIVLAATLVLVVVVLVIVLLARFWKPKSPQPTASDRALRQLNRLQSLQLLAKAQGERHFTLLTSILRRYLEKAYGASSASATTREFLEAATRNSLLEPHLTFLREFMSASDVAKFAPPASVALVGRDLDDKLRVWLSSQSATEIAGRT